MAAGSICLIVRPRRGERCLSRRVAPHAAGHASAAAHIDADDTAPWLPLLMQRSNPGDTLRARWPTSIRHRRCTPLFGGGWDSARQCGGEKYDRKSFHDESPLNGGPPIVVPFRVSTSMRGTGNQPFRLADAVRLQHLDSHSRKHCSPMQVRNAGQAVPANCGLPPRRCRPGICGLCLLSYRKTNKKTEGTHEDQPARHQHRNPVA